MVISRTQGQGDMKHFDPIMAQMPVLSGLPQSSGLGFNWGLAIQIAGWTINGIGLGLSTYEAVKGAKAQAGVEKLEESEIQAIASQIAQADPQHRTSGQWESILRGQFGGGGLTPEPVPPGFYRDPQTGQLVPIKQAGTGFFGALPTWAWVIIGGLGFVVLRGKGLKI